MKQLPQLHGVLYFCRYYDDFKIDIEKGISNLTQLYIKVKLILVLFAYYGNWFIMHTANQALSFGPL